MRVRIERVEPAHSVFQMAFASEVVSGGETQQALASQLGKLSLGLYRVSQLFLGFGVDESIECEPGSLEFALFEVRAENQEPRSQGELIEEYKRVLEERDRDFLRGIGRGANQYRVFVFVKDCLFTQRTRVGQLEVIPRRGLACNDELAVMDGFLQEIGHPALANVEKSLEAARHGQPVFVAHFPLVNADAFEQAGDLARSQVEALVTLLALQRGGAGAVFSVLVQDLKTMRSRHQLHVPNYGANLCGGWISGEDPRTLVQRLGALQSSEDLQLYVGLFREAQAETGPEFRLFRYWALLETIARRRGFEGLPQRDWSGIMRHSAKGKALMIRSGEAHVFELLRTCLGDEMGEGAFASGLRQGLLSQQVRIWYRRRNCLAHGGACQCRGSDVAEAQDDEFQACRAAREEVGGTPDDGYLRSLRAVVERVLAAEFWRVVGAGSADG